MSTRACATCGRENPSDRDFCGRDEYLNWEPTGFVDAVTPEMAAAAAAEAVAPAAPAEPVGAAPPQVTRLERTSVRERASLVFVAWTTDGIALLETPSPHNAARLVILPPALPSKPTDDRKLDAITGCQLAWEPGGRLAVAERGCSPHDTDGPVRPIDPTRPNDRPIALTSSGANPARRPQAP